jgi:hypothetical protein
MTTCVQKSFLKAGNRFFLFNSLLRIQIRISNTDSVPKEPNQVGCGSRSTTLEERYYVVLLVLIFAFDPES